MYKMLNFDQKGGILRLSFIYKSDTNDEMELLEFDFFSFAWGFQYSIVLFSIYCKVLFYNMLLGVVE